MNSVNLMGRLTADPELRKTNTSQTSVCNFTIAVDKIKSKEGVKEAEFIECVVWGKLAESLTSNQKKGWIIGVSGRLENTLKKKNEVEYQSIIVNVDEIKFTKWENLFDVEDNS